MMAVTENKPFTPDPAIDFDGSIAGLLFEVQIATTALRFGIQTLAKRTDADPLRECCRGCPTKIVKLWRPCRR
jgi:hypothetical protein